MQISKSEQQATTVKWKLYTRNENVSPPLEGPETKQHDSQEDALEAALRRWRRE